MDYRPLDRRSYYGLDILWMSAWLYRLFHSVFSWIDIVVSESSFRPLVVGKILGSSASPSDSDGRG